jgi:hypothetical protein
VAEHELLGQCPTGRVPTFRLTGPALLLKKASNYEAECRH